MKKISHSKNMVNLSGPVSSYYLKKEKKRIYLFGDEHYSLSNVCHGKSLDIIDFLENIFTENDGKRIDFFIENKYSDEEKDTKFKKKSLYEEAVQQFLGTPGTSYLSKIINHFKFKGCLIKNKSQCEKTYPNIHFHSADFRSSKKCKYSQKMEDLTISLFLFSMIPKELILKSEKTLQKVEKMLLEFHTYSKLIKTIQMGLKCKIIQKELKECETNAKKAILRYINDFFLIQKKSYEFLYNENMRKLIICLKNRKKMLSISELNSYLYYLQSIVIHVNTVLMDVYLLSKLLKHYENGSGPEFSIIYAGNAHIDNYVHFLQKYMNFRLVSGGLAMKKRCIQMKKWV